MVKDQDQHGSKDDLAKCRINKGRSSFYHLSRIQNNVHLNEYLPFDDLLLNKLLAFMGLG